MKVCAWSSVAQDKGSTIFNKQGLVQMTLLNVRSNSVAGANEPQLTPSFEIRYPAISSALLSDVT